MATAQSSSTETLFHQWRKGDAEAGQAMAQRFTDWYFAIATTRLGEASGDAPFREACTAFSQGVAKVSDARRLLGWAHTIARKNIHGATSHGRVPDLDAPNAFTRNASPKDLLTRARTALPDAMHSLEHAYRGTPVDDPYALLEARYALKQWLSTNFEIPFRVQRSAPDADLCPLPFYEAGQMASESEDTHFELYMLHDMEVCQDIAEFAHYAIALRGGLAGEPPARTQAPSPKPQGSQPRVEPPTPATPAPGTPASSAATPAEAAKASTPRASEGPDKLVLIAGGIFAIAILFGLAAVVLTYVLG